MPLFRMILISSFLLLSLPLTGSTAPVPPKKTDKCPVCGMFIVKYPDWVAQILFKDGSLAHFDGAKDMFKYYFTMERYNPNKKQSDIAEIYATDYYTMKALDARTSWFVIGSDVYGPMGHELIPFSKQTDAAEFMRDHKGKQMIRFSEVTPELIAKLD